jgi:hypothetical protein
MVHAPHRRVNVLAVVILAVSSTAVLVPGVGHAQCVPPPTGMVSWWPGDGNATDIQTGDSATVTGGATFAPGMVEEAFSFPTPGAVNISYSSTPTPAGITVDAWVNPSATVGGASIFNWRPAGNTVGITLEQQFAADGQVLWNVFGSAGSEASVFSGSTHLALNTWTHLAGTYDGTTARLYFNGTQVASSTGASGALAAIDANAAIGQNIVFAGGSFLGLIDEVEVFDRALSASEIQAIFNAGAAGKCVPLSGCFTMNGAPLTGVKLSVKEKKLTSSPETDSTGCFADSALVAGKKFKVMMNGPSVTGAPLSGCFKLMGAPLVNASVSIKQQVKTPLKTDTNGCFSDESVTAGSPFTLQLKGPIVP